MMQEIQPSVLATDLDGTFIPLADVVTNQRDLQLLTRAFSELPVQLVYVTGRHRASVEEKIVEQRLPLPEWLICDVGTSLHARRQDDLEFVPEYTEFLAEIVAGFSRDELRRAIGELPGLRLQEDVKQGPHKLSYYAEASQLPRLVEQVQSVLQQEAAPWTEIHSIDPFNGSGLLDLLPAGVSKARALEWWCEFTDTDRQAIVYAGDSGNDWAAFIAGYRTIVVANTDRKIAHRVQREHQQQGFENRLHLARQTATSGVLEGCLEFGLLPPEFAPNLH